MEYVTENGLRWLPESSWQPVLQRSIDAYYEGELEEGTAACRLLLNSIGVPDHVRDVTYVNQVYYAQPLLELVPEAILHPFMMDDPAVRAVRDPSPLIVEDRIVVFMRAQNDRNGNDQALSRAVFSEFEGVDIAVISEDILDGYRLRQFFPFSAGNRLYAALVAQERAENGHARAGIISLSGGQSESHLFGPRPDSFRGGWLPLVVDDQPSFIGWWEPTEVFRFEEETAAFERAALRMAPHIAERFQGGSQGVPVPGGYLFLVNETVSPEPENIVVLSRFVRLDQGFQVTHVSPQLFVSQRGKDLATGLARKDARLIAGFTTGESGAALATLDLEAVLGTLIPVEAPGPLTSTT